MKLVNCGSVSLLCVMTMLSCTNLIFYDCDINKYMYDFELLLYLFVFFVYMHEKNESRKVSKLLKLV